MSRADPIYDLLSLLDIFAIVEFSCAQRKVKLRLTCGAWVSEKYRLNVEQGHVNLRHAVSRQLEQLVRPATLNPSASLG